MRLLVDLSIDDAPVVVARGILIKLLKEPYVGINNMKILASPITNHMDHMERGNLAVIWMASLCHTLNPGLTNPVQHNDVDCDIDPKALKKTWHSLALIAHPSKDHYRLHELAM